MRRRTLLTAVTLAALVRPMTAIRPALAARPQGLILPDRPKPLPPLMIGDGEGEPVPLRSLPGRLIVLNLWASWCLPCLTELPALDRAKAALAAEGIAVVALSLDRLGRSAVLASYAKLKIRHLDVALDVGREAGTVLAAPSLPTTLLIDRHGNEVARYVGAAEWDGAAAVALLRALAAGESPNGIPAPPPMRTILL